MEFQSISLARDHGLSWSKNAPKFGIFLIEKIENFVDKYLTTNQSIFIT